MWILPDQNENLFGRSESGYIIFKVRKDVYSLSALLIVLPLDSKIGTLGAYVTDGTNTVRRTVLIKRLMYALFRACL